MTTVGDPVSAEVLALIDDYVAALVAAAPAPTEEQVVQLRRWFGPRRDTDRRDTPHRHGDAA